MIRKLLLAALVAAGFVTPAFSQTSFTAKDAAAATQTFKSFSCAGPTICSLSVPADTTGAAFGVTGNPFFVTNNGTFAVQAGQTGTWTLQPGNTANTTPWIFQISNAAGSAQAQVVANSDALANQVGVSANAQNQVYNGTTWDRLRGDTTNGAFVNVKTSVLPTGASTSANQTSQITQETATAAALGTTADAVCGTATGNCSLLALQKYNNATNPVFGTGSNTVGNFGADPSSGKATPTEAFLALPATTTTQIIALSGSTKTYVTSAVVLAGGTVNVTFKYGTGSNCGTGTTTLNGPWPLTAQAGFTKGAGTGAVMIVPAGQALCITTDASVTGGVDLTYQQF